VASILKDIYDRISKKNRINVIGLDVGNGLARQHDCKRHEQLHSNFGPFECEGCRKQFAGMDALNRHLRNEIGVECARGVERGKGSGGVLGDLDSGFDDRLVEEVVRIFVWGDIMSDAFNLNFHPLYRFASHCRISPGYERDKGLYLFILFFSVCNLL